jgi:hypothetical protein
MVWAGLVQTKGFGSPLCRRTQSRMVFWRSATDLKTPRRIALRVMTEKKFSTALSHACEPAPQFGSDAISMTVCGFHAAPSNLA